MFFTILQKVAEVIMRVCVLSCVHMTKICVYANFAYIYANFAYMQILHICKFCIREQKYFLLRVHMDFKDQQNLSKVEILFYKSNSYFLELRTCFNKYFYLDPASE